MFQAFFTLQCDVHICLPVSYVFQNNVKIMNLEYFVVTITFGTIASCYSISYPTDVTISDSMERTSLKI
jgi:hypothetical protein